MKHVVRRMTAWFFLMSTAMNFNIDNPATWFGLVAGIGFWLGEAIWGNE